MDIKKDGLFIKSSRNSATKELSLYAQKIKNELANKEYREHMIKYLPKRVHQPNMAKLMNDMDDDDLAILLEEFAYVADMSKHTLDWIRDTLLPHDITEITLEFFKKYCERKYPINIHDKEESRFLDVFLENSLALLRVDGFVHLGMHDGQKTIRINVIHFMDVIDPTFVYPNEK